MLLLNRDKLIKILNWFYSLEVNQVDLYLAQSKQVEDIYIKKALERIAEIEEQHVKNIATQIKELGGEPTFIGKVLAPITGQISGRILGWAGIINILKVNIMLEKKAMEDYKKFILKVNDPQLFDLLWSNLIDEDLHTSWFTNKVKELIKNENN